MDVNKYYFVLLTLLLCYESIAANNVTNTVSGSRRSSGNSGSSDESGSGAEETFDNPDLDRRALCPSGLDDLKSYLCHSVRAFVAEFPGGGAATYFLDTFFRTGDSSTQKWDAIKTQVEKYVAEQLDVVLYREYEVERNSMIGRVKTCKDKTQPDKILDCYQNLQEDLSGYKAIFTGITDKEKALYYKYYEFFVTTFLSVSDKLIEIGDADMKRSIRDDVSRKAAEMKTGYTSCIVGLAPFVGIILRTDH